MHPALLRLIRVLAECEAERLCAEQEKGPEAEEPPGRKNELMNPHTHRQGTANREQG